MNAMKLFTGRITLLACIIFAFSFMFSSCGEKAADEAKKEIKETEPISKEAENPAPAQQAKKIFDIEAAYIKFKNISGGQEMIREWSFADYGNKQFEDNYMTIAGEKTGGYSLIMDAWKYDWSYDNKEGSKMKYFQSRTDYDNPDERYVEKYGLKKLGFEEVAGKKCSKISMEKPSRSTIWVWNGIILKMDAEYGGQKVLSEALEIREGNVNAGLFKLPENITFNEFK